MSPDEQAERDRIAVQLDTLIGICAMWLGPDARPDIVPPAERPDPLEFWRKRAVA